MGFASMISQWSEGTFSGAMISVDNVPPLFLGFPFAPTSINDSFGVELSFAGSPGSRYKYPMLKSGKERKISFQLKFDAEHPAGKKGGGVFLNSEYRKAKGGTLIGDRIQAQHIATSQSLIEKFKSPKQNLVTSLQSVSGAFLKAGSSSTDPAPPLTLLILNPFKLMLGYVGEANIQQIRFNKHMFCTRMIVDVSFYVTPDYIFTTLEDAGREVNALLSAAS